MHQLNIFAVFAVRGQEPSNLFMFDGSTHRPLLNCKPGKSSEDLLKEIAGLAQGIPDNDTLVCDLPQEVFNEVTLLARKKEATSHLFPYRVVAFSTHWNSVAVTVTPAVAATAVA